MATRASIQEEQLLRWAYRNCDPSLNGRHHLPLQMLAALEQWIKGVVLGRNEAKFLPEV